jgi:hypothetical protein
MRILWKTRGANFIMSIRSYRIALTASLILNAMLVGLIWLYLHFEGFYSTIESFIEIFG